MSSTLLKTVIAGVLAFSSVLAWANDKVHSPGRPTFCERTLSYSDSIALAQERAAWLAQQPVESPKELLYPTPEILQDLRNRGIELRHAEQWSIGGRVPGLKQFKHGGTVVFRQYVQREFMPAVLAAKELISGYLPFIQVEPGLTHTSYSDLTGVFLTLPGVERYKVGLDHVGRSYGFVDFTLDPEVPVLEIEEGQILLIPLPSRIRAWVAEKYLRYMAGDRSPDVMQHEAEILRLQSRGGAGVNEAVGRVRIHIVGHGEG